MCAYFATILGFKYKEFRFAISLGVQGVGVVMDRKTLGGGSRGTGMTAIRVRERRQKIKPNHITGNWEQSDGETGTLVTGVSGTGSRGNTNAN